MKPLILITSSFAAESNESRADLPEASFDYLKCAYSEKIYRAGGIPIIVPNTEIDNDSIMQVINSVDGVLLSGGADINPGFYGQEKHPKTKVSHQRDMFEWKFIKKVLLENKIPVLAICRGHQLVNIALGGTLFQDIELFRQARRNNHDIEHCFVNAGGKKNRSWHWVKVESNSLLFKITGERRLYVNSSHHQFVNEIGEGLVPTAFAEDGAVESLEFKNPDRFLLSVQWHPEDMEKEWQKLDTKPDGANINWVPKLFRAFVESCSR